ncbi:MAG: hypothetical protein N2C13_05210, partial [Chloroflexota bacterium]
EVNMINGWALFQAIKIIDNNVQLRGRAQVDSLLTLLTSLINKWKEYRQEHAGQVYMTSSIRFE